MRQYIQNKFRQVFGAVTGDHTKTASSHIEIFVDMDGVLSDFDSHAKAHGKYDEKGQPKWNELDFEWWATMPVYDGAREFYEGLRAVGNTRILTAPVPAVDSFAGKAEWVATKFRPDKGRFALLDLCIVRAKDKHLMAGARRVLIDDREKNVAEWEAAGGIGIHHTGDFAQTQEKLKQVLAGSNLRYLAPPKP